MKVYNEILSDLIGKGIGVEIDKHRCFRKHSHNFFEIFIVLEGRVTHYVGKQAFVLDKNSLALIRPNEEHGFARYHGQSHTRINIPFNVKTGKQLLDAVNPGFYDSVMAYEQPIYITLSDEQVKNIYSTAHTIMTMSDNRDSSAYYGLLRSLVLKPTLYVFEQFVVTRPAYPDWLNEFVNLITKPENICLKITELSALSNYSYSHLSKLFKNYTKKTLLEYFREAKLSYAKKLLEITDYSCREIADRTGYQSPSHFNKAYKSLYGVTPSQYRTTLRK